MCKRFKVEFLGFFHRIVYSTVHHLLVCLLSICSAFLLSLFFISILIELRTKLLSSINWNLTKSFFRQFLKYLLVTLFYMSEKLSAIIKSSMDLIRFFFQSFQRFSFKLLLMAFLSDYLIFKGILIDVRVVTGKKLIIVWMQSWILLEFCWNWIKFDSIGLNWIAMNWNRFFFVYGK